jgi:chitin disaccharide deacetylase
MTSDPEKLSLDSHSLGELAGARSETFPAGCLIVNADDWGRDGETTTRTLECILRGTVSSVSAMVYMADSERAANIARGRGIDAGLHLNFTTPFSGSNCPAGTLEHQRRVAAYLLRHSFAQAVYNPWLAGSFEHLVNRQLEEFHRLYGTEPGRVDGHHHMHLSANVVFGNLLPEGTIVRRNFSFRADEKSLGNRLYRKIVDRKLRQNHSLVDFFFSLPPLEPASRLQRIFSLARRFTVELETHPINSDEYQFLTGGEILRIENLQVATRYAVCHHRQQ